MLRSAKYLALATAVFIASCGNNQEPADTTAPPAESTPTEDVVPSGAEANVSIMADDDMMFDTDKITVKEGQKVTLTLIHNGKMDKNGMGHNWVLLKAGTDYKDFSTKAATERENEYIPESEKDLIIAHTKLIGGGESTTITFDAPPPGEYPFLCSFPAHAAMMHGTFVVLPK